jgi:ketosteroid isomerase-like protein
MRRAIKMFKNNLDYGVAYYQAMSDKNMAFIEKCLAPNVHFIGPMAETTGKAAYLESVEKFFSLFQKLTVRAQFVSGDQAMLAYDVEFPAPIGSFRTAALLTFKDNLITSIELFFNVGNTTFSK